MSLPEELLIESLKRGDNKAFEYVYKYYYKGLCAYAYTFLKDHHDAEEIVQDFFTELWAQIEKVDVKASLKLYLFRGIHNKCINHLKSHAVMERRREKYTRLALEEIELLDIDTESEEYEYFFSESFENEVKNSINQLPVQQKQIFEYSRFYQKTYAEIAKELDISVNTVKTQISRALQKLRSQLTNKIKNHPFLFFFMRFIAYY